MSVPSHRIFSKIIISYKRTKHMYMIKSPSGNYCSFLSIRKRKCDTDVFSVVFPISFMHSTSVKQKFVMILNFHFLINKKEQQFPEGDFIKYICTTLPFLRIFCDSVPTLKGCAIIMKIVALSDVFILSIHVCLSYYLDYIKGSC